MSLAIGAIGEYKMKLCLSLCLQVVLLGGLAGSVSQELDPNVLLDKYDLCNTKLQNIYYELESTKFPSLRPGKRVVSLKYCSKNGKKQWIGQRAQYKQDGTLDQTGSSLLTDIYGDNMGVHLQFYNPDLQNKRPPTAALLRSSRDKYVQSYTNHPPYGGSLIGRFGGSNDQSICDLLKGASNLQLHNEPTKIVGYNAYLIEANTKYGFVKAWISPDVDYNCLKWEIIKGQNQLYRDGLPTDDRFTEWRAVFDAEKVELIDNHYFITKARLHFTVHNGDMALIDDTFHFNLRNINVSPDYEALGAFEIQLPEGTVVRDEDVPGIRYQWIGGRLKPLMDDAVIDTIDSAVVELRNSRNTVPKKLLENPQEDASAKQAVEPDANQLPDGQITTIEGAGENASWATTKKLLCYVIGVCLILAAAFFVYSHRRKIRANES